MVMEAGKMDLLAWRALISIKTNRSKRIPPTRGPIKDGRPSYPEGSSMQLNGMTDLEESMGEEWATDSPKGLPDEAKEEPLTRHKLAMCLALYADALLIGSLQGRRHQALLHGRDDER